MKADGKGPVFSGAALALVIAGAAGALAALWWTGSRCPGIDFLPAMAPAEWIAYPAAAGVESHQILEMPTVFEKSFVLERAPSSAVLRVAGFHRYSLAVNGAPPGRPVEAGANWKRPDAFDVAGQLKCGTNLIRVTVFNSRGPPALWFSLDADGLRVNSGSAWRASCAGAAWRAAVPAAAPRTMTDAGAVYQMPRPWASLGLRWPTLLAFALAAAAGCWLLRKAAAAGFFDSITAHSPAPGTGDRLRRFLPPAVLAVLWVALFANNLGSLPRLTGFDAQGHLDYIRYIQDHGSLPLASQGWEMFQPPLYYVLSAAWLGLFRLPASGAAGIMALRILGMAVGIAHIAIAWAAIRLLFPSDCRKAGPGLVLAAFLPPMLYLSQYVTNEAFAAMLISACLLLTLRALQQERLTWTLCAGLGICLGAALLAKATALLVLPFVFGALLWKRLEGRGFPPALWFARIGLIIALCTLVGGWHYARLRLHYGDALIANWDPRLGMPWWQDDGYRTGAYYLRFGDALLRPWSGASQSFADGIYATLWGDGSLGGAADFLSRPPWHYDLMAAGYWLAVLPALAVLAGVIAAVFRFVTRPSAEWFLLLGFGFIVVLAMIRLSLAVPYNSVVKAVFGLSALIPFCTFGALGMELVTRRIPKLRGLVCIALGLWAINSYASFWISRSSVPYAIEHACALARAGRIPEAAGFLEQRLRSEPRNADLRFTLAYFLTITGRVDEGLREAGALVREHPDDCRGHHVMALAYAMERQAGRAIGELRRIMTLAPGYDPCWDDFTLLLIESAQPDEAAGICRQALSADPFSPGLRLALGAALLLQDKVDEAAGHLRTAFQLNPGSVDALLAVAWRWSTSPQPARRNGAAAVKLAEQACALTGFSKAVDIDILAAAYAEAGRFDDAVAAARRAEALAASSGDPRGVSASRELLRLLKAGRPYHD